MLKFLNPRNWGVVQVYRDIDNYIDWINTIKKEKLNSQSSFNKWKLQHTKLYDVYIVTSLDEIDSQLPEAVQRTKVLESLNPLHRYLDEKLGFADSLDCEFNQFQDDKGKLTLSYLIVYKFRFNRFSIKWLLKFILIWSTIIFIVCKFNLIQWVLNLI